jgi:Tfp pilus assembly protein PilO
MTDVRRIVFENRRMVWTIAAALIVNLALYALVVYPLSNRVDTEQRQAGDATRDLNAARRAHDTAKGTVTGKKEADSELQKFYREVLPPDQSAARRLLYLPLNQLARKSNLTSLQTSLQPEPERKTGLGKLTVTLNLEGEYDNIRRFIHELETAPEFLVLESVVVRQGSEGERTLSVVAQIATYYMAGGNGN